MAIAAADVNKLRQQTGAGMMDCKKALEETNGNFEEAVVYLRKKGAKVSDKRADRDSKEGVCVALTSEDGKRGVVVRIACETDFVAKGEDFINFGKLVAGIALDQSPADIEALKSIKSGELTISEHLDEMCGKIGEKIQLNAYEQLNGTSVTAYIHAGYKIGVIAQATKAVGDGAVVKDVCMQIAAMNPVAVDETSVDPKIIERELEIAKEQLAAEGKPADMIEKIAQGKIQRFYKDNTLIHQVFVKDGSKSVKDILAQADKDLHIVAFYRVQLGA